MHAFDKNTTWELFVQQRSHSGPVDSVCVPVLTFDDTRDSVEQRRCNAVDDTRGSVEPVDTRLSRCLFLPYYYYYYHHYYYLYYFYYLYYYDHYY